MFLWTFAHTCLESWGRFMHFTGKQDIAPYGEHRHWVTRTALPGCWASSLTYVLLANREVAIKKACLGGQEAKAEAVSRAQGKWRKCWAMQSVWRRCWGCYQAAFFGMKHSL